MLAGPLVCSACEGDLKCFDFMPGWVLSGKKKQFFSVPPKLQFLSIHEFILTITFGQVYSTRLGMASDPLTVVPPLQPAIGTSPR